MLEDKTEREEGDSWVQAVVLTSCSYCETNILLRVGKYTVLHKAARGCILSLLKLHRQLSIDTVHSLLQWIPQMLAKQKQIWSINAYGEKAGTAASLKDELHAAGEEKTTFPEKDQL